MKDIDKTKEQLIKELSEKRRRIAALEMVEDKQKMPEEALKISENKYRLLFKAEQDAIILVDSETRKIVDANDSALHLYGFGKEEILKLTGPDLSAEPEQSKAAIEKLAVSTNGHVHYHTRNHKKKDGTVFPVEISSGTFILKSKKIISAIIRDITERQKALQELSESEERFRQLAENITEVFYISNLQTHQMLYISPGYELLWGQSCESLYSNPYSFVEAIHPDYREKVKSLLERQLQGEKTEEVYQIVRPDQSMRWIRDRAFPIKGDDGNVERVIGIAEDITYQKISEKKIRESNEHYHSLLDISPDAIVETGLNGKILFCNQQASKMHGYGSPDELIGQDSLQSMFEEDIHIAQNNAALLLDKGYFKNMTYRMRKKDGTSIPVEVSASLLRDAEGIPKSFIGYLRDISERKNAENEQRRLTEELIIKNKELEQVLYVTSHDLRSPLVNVEGYSKELEYSLKELMSSIEHVDVPLHIKDKITPIVKEDIPESLHYIKISVLKINALLKSILTLSRLGRSKLTLAEIDMNAMMNDIVDNHSFSLKELGIKTEVSKLPDCKGDSAQINQVFSNLLDNAVKYTDQERPGVLHISGYKDKNQSVYCIDDNGIGISPEHQDKIFEIFHQLEPNRVKGEGMGLTIANRILERHKGKIWVESDLGRGSKFFVSLSS